jgi:RNA polymerase sigma-70 factor (ECF subfamily)
VSFAPREWVEQARAGDVEAFRRLYVAHAGRVHAVCLRILGNDTRAEEATQEVFVKAWKALPRFEGRSAFSTWLHRLAVNVVLDARRTETRRAEDPLPDTETVGRTVSTPDLAVDLEREIRRLPATARMAFVLHDVEGYKHREIAEMTGTAEGTWKAQLHRARRLLREALER